MCKGSTYNQQILLETSFWCNIQQEQWIGWLKYENNGNGRGRPSWISTFGLVKIQKWFQKSALCETFDRKSGITPVSMTVFFWSTFSIWTPAAILNLDVWARQNTINDTRKWTHIAENEFLVWNSASNMGYMAQNRKMELVDGGHLEIWYLDSSKYKNDARNGLSIPHLEGKVILHGFLWPFTFNGRRRPSWNLMVGLVKIQKRCQKWILYAKISRISGITQLSISICFQVTFPIWPPAAILDFGFSQIPPPFSRGSWGLNFF